MTGLSERDADKVQKPPKKQKSSKGKQEVQLPERLQDFIGEKLRLYYAELIKEPVPDRLLALIDQLADKDRQT